MVEKIRFGGDWSVKKTVAAILFSAIIIVFVFWGVKPATMGDATEGVAAVVNDQAIPLSDLRNRVEQEEQFSRMRMEGLPEAQRRMYSQKLRQQVLNQLVTNEVIYQAAHKRGLTAPDNEVRDQILQIPVFQENGRFISDRYRMFLESRQMTPQGFERELRKDIVNQRLRELFVSSSAPAQEELKRNRALANFKVNLRYFEIRRDDWARFAAITPADVSAFQAQHKAEIEAYYKDNMIEFSDPEKYHARDIVIRVDEKRKDAEAKKLAEDVRKQLTAQNFAKLAAKYSEDPGTKEKGGDLGELERGSLQPEFEMAALPLAAGEISRPVQLPGGYHIIYMVSKKGGSKRELAQVEQEIARRLLARSREPEVLNRLREMVEKGDAKDIEGYLAKAGIKAKETGEFDLSSSLIPKIGESKEIMSYIVQQGKKGGLVRRLIPLQTNYLIIEPISWKEVPETPSGDVDGLSEMVAYRKAQSAISTWLTEEESKASIQRNPRLLQ